MTKYRAIVTEVVEREEIINSMVSNVVLDHFKITFEQFTTSYQVGL